MTYPCLPNPENSEDHLRAILLRWNVLGRLSIVLPLLFFCIARIVGAQEDGNQRNSGSNAMNNYNYMNNNNNNNNNEDMNNGNTAQENYLRWQLQKQHQMSERLELVAYIWGVLLFLLLMWYGLNTMKRLPGFKVERLFGALFVFANLSLLCGILVANYTIGALSLRDFSTCIAISFIFWAVYSGMMGLLLMDYQRQQELKSRQQPMIQTLFSASAEEQNKQNQRSIWSFIDPTYNSNAHNVEPKGDATISTPYSFL